MTFFKVLFILMLLAPVAYLMRTLLKRISSEIPAQTDSNVPIDARITVRRKSSVSGKGNRKGADQQTVKGFSGGRKARSDDSYTLRQPQRWQRSERVPFGESEGYRVDNPRKRPIAENSDAKGWKKPSDALKERKMEDFARSQERVKMPEISESIAFAKEEKATKKRKRSEKSPSKRQLRKNRERARKRDMRRHKEGRDSK